MMRFFLCLLIFSVFSVTAVFSQQSVTILPDYDEIADPNLNLTLQSLMAHESQWTLFLKYTMNNETPGFVEPIAYNMLIDGKLRLVPFYRFRNGPVIETNKKLDFCLQSFGTVTLFSVLTPLGEAYTRDGRFTLDENRRLVMVAGGNVVLGVGGQIYLPEGEVTVSKAGVIYVDGEPIDQFKVSVFDKPSVLEPLNGSIFMLAEPMRPGILREGEDKEYAVRQGFIEYSNVLKSIIGDIALAKNAYVANGKAAKALNRAMGSAIQMGNP